MNTFDSRSASEKLRFKSFESPHSFAYQITKKFLTFCDVLCIVGTAFEIFISRANPRGPDVFRNSVCFGFLKFSTSFIGPISEILGS